MNFFRLDVENSYDIRHLGCEYFCKLPHSLVYEMSLTKALVKLIA